MTIEVGDIVKFKEATSPHDVGRVCKDNGTTFCVYWSVAATCLRVGKGSLEVTTGDVPPCPAECTAGC